MINVRLGNLIKSYVFLKRRSGKGSYQSQKSKENQFFEKRKLFTQLMANFSRDQNIYAK